MMQFGTRRTANPRSLGSTASSGKWNRMGAHCPCSGARRYPTRSTRALASMTALYDAKRARLNNKLSSAQLRKSRCGKSNTRVGQARSVAIRENAGAVVALFSTVAVMSMCGETKYIPRKSTVTIFRALSAKPRKFFHRPPAGVRRGAVVVTC